MLKQPINYVNLDGKEDVEIVYLNLTKKELLDKEMSHPGGYGEYLNRIVESGDNREIYRCFCEFIDGAYGIRSEDGKRFIKKKELLEEFQQTEAYSELIFQMMSDPELGAKVIEALLPQDILREAKDHIQSQENVQ